MSDMRPIADLAAELSLTDSELIPYGRYKAKIACRCSSG